MSKSTLAKIAAIVCSAASLSMLGMAASAQIDEDVNPGTVTKTQIIAGKVTVEDSDKDANGDYIVKFPVYVYQPEGTAYAATGLRLIYAEGLAPNLNDKGKVITKKGDAGDDITMTFSTNDEKRIIGLGTMGADGEADSGLMYTVEIKVPGNAAPGTEYPMTLEVERWLDVDVQAIENETVAGYIKVPGTPETTTAVTTTTPAPTTTTTTVTTTVSTTLDTTTTTTSTTVSGTTTTTTASGSTTATKAATTTAAATTTKGSGSTTATKTGDAGVGVAVAGLMIAAGTAIAATKKKKED